MTAGGEGGPAGADGTGVGGATGVEGAPAVAGGVAAGGGWLGAFFTDRIVFPGAAATGPLAGGVGVPGAWLRIRARIRAASSSLMELLWLRAAIASFSAASSTSLLSRPKSRDSS